MPEFNFWDRRLGTVYLIRGHHPRTGRRIRAYVGKTTQRPWTKRIEQHLWGRGQYNNPPQPWADTVPGWRPAGIVTDVIAAGGVQVLYSRKCSPFGLWWREIFFIWLMRPRYNYQWNRHNAARITKTAARQQRSRRDRVGASETAFDVMDRAARRWVAVLPVLLMVGVLLIPGVPTGVADTAVWGWRNPFDVVVVAVVAALATRRARLVLKGKRR